MKANRRIVKKDTPKRFATLSKALHLLRVGVVSLLCLVLVSVVGFYSIEFTQQFLNRPITSIVVKGEFNYLDNKEMKSHVQQMIGGSFVGENINHIKSQLQKKMWVDTVTLRRMWPDRLQVNITEQVPIARWGDEGFVNVRGELIMPVLDERLLHLPKLYGEQQEAIVLMQQYSMLANIFQPYGLSITELEKDPRGVWQLSLDNSWQIMLGRGDVLKKIRRLTYVLDSELLDNHANILSIDMRYTNGLAVQWVSSIENKKQGQTNAMKQRNITQKNMSHKMKLSYGKQLMQPIPHKRG